MARVKVCRLCGRQNEPDELFCEAADCGVSLADVSVVDSSAVGAGAAGGGTAGGSGPDSGSPPGDGLPAGGGSGPGPGPVAGGPGPGSVAGGPIPRPVADGRTVRDGLDQAPPCALLFPWGRVPVAGELRIGREAEFSPISQRLDAFSTVSRRHAVVGAAQGRWTVRDLGSTNGTFVNSARLAEGETRPVQNGDRVNFSQGLQVQVEIAAAGGARGG